LPVVVGALLAYRALDVAIDRWDSTVLHTSRWRCSRAQFTPSL